MKAPVQHGPQLKAVVVHLGQHPMLPAQRTADGMAGLYDVPLSDATVLAAVTEANERLEGTVAAIGHAVVATPVV